MRHLALIPARKGSSGLPGKNMLPIGGMSLVERAIRCAQQSCQFDEIAVSSDWDEVLKLAEKFGCRAVPRPASIAGPETPVEAVVRHALDWRSENVGDEDFVSVCVLNPTSPFRVPEDIALAYKLFNEYHPQSVVSVHEIKPVLMARVRRGKRLLYHEAQFQWRNRQRRKPLLAQNGAVYIVSVPYFRETGKLVGEKGLIYMMPSQPNSCDIDSYWDYLSALAWEQEIQKVKGKGTPDEPVKAEAAPEGSQP